MGTFRQPMEVGDVQQDHFEIVDAWVDSGATYTWLPRDLLRRLGHTPTFHRQFRLNTGDVIERDLCWVAIRLHEETQPTPCVFGDEGSDPLMGAMVLETFSLGVDPVNRMLIPVLSNLL